MFAGVDLYIGVDFAEEESGSLVVALLNSVDLDPEDNNGFQTGVYYVAHYRNIGALRSGADTAICFAVLLSHATSYRACVSDT